MAIAIGITVGLALLAYLFGSLPTGYLVGLTKGIDIRQYGSGGTGATNVLRTLGKSYALFVLIVDLLKGAAAIATTRYVVAEVGAWVPDAVNWPSWQAWVITLAGLLAVLGHSRSVWIQFTGGKSAATGLGVILTMAWPVGIGILAAFIFTLVLFRMVSLGSIVAAIATAVLMVAFNQPLPYILLGIAGGLYVILRHQTNIQRILAGTEPRLGQNSSQQANHSGQVSS